VEYSRQRPGRIPTALSVDGAGNLYMVTSKLNDNTTSAVWVLPASATSSSGYAATPLLIDATFATANGVKVSHGKASSPRRRRQPGTWAICWCWWATPAVRNSQNNTNDANVLVYRAASIGAVLGGSGPRSAPEPDPHQPQPVFRRGEFPLGMDFWPPDALSGNTTLLLTTTAGRILRFDFNAAGGRCGPDSEAGFRERSGQRPAQAQGRPGIRDSLRVRDARRLGAGSGRILQFGAPVTPGTTKPDRNRNDGA